jgi:transposase-like protein
MPAVLQREPCLRPLVRPLEQHQLPVAGRRDCLLPEDSVGRDGYPPEFRRKVLDLVKAGRPAVDVARDLGISAQSIDTWRQDRIDKRREPG